ncbi:hypothetical protein C8R47DRAFT_812113 [Mycena vitilis]|nr:hypothetical protein C8R47DRAFT_812113 [Mycena vitilis]
MTVYPCVIPSLGAIHPPLAQFALQFPEIVRAEAQGANLRPSAVDEARRVIDVVEAAHQQNPAVVTVNVVAAAGTPTTPTNSASASLTWPSASGSAGATPSNAGKVVAGLIVGLVALGFLVPVGLKCKFCPNRSQRALLSALTPRRSFFFRRRRPSVLPTTVSPSTVSTFTYYPPTSNRSPSSTNNSSAAVRTKRTTPSSPQRRVPRTTVSRSRPTASAPDVDAQVPYPPSSEDTEAAANAQISYPPSAHSPTRPTTQVIRFAEELSHGEDIPIFHPPGGQTIDSVLTLGSPSWLPLSPLHTSSLSSYPPGTPANSSTSLLTAQAQDQETPSSSSNTFGRNN